MAQPNFNLQTWLTAAVAGIRFRPDRAAVEQELREHIEDKTADLLRIFPDMTREEAEARALSGMGDPEELGRELAKVHKPWLGYLWQVSRFLLGAVLLLSLVAWGGRALGQFQSWMEAGQSHTLSIEECYRRGIDPFGPEGPYHDEDSGGKVTRTPLLVFHPEDSARAAEYRLTVGQAALWSFRRDEGEDWWLFCDLRALGPPWQPLGDEVAQYIRAEDSLGNRYYSTYEVYDQHVERGEDGYVMANPGHGGLWDRRFDLCVLDIQPGARWLRLVYDREGVQWALTIPLTEETG